MKKITIFFSVLLIFTFFFVGSSFAANTDYPPVPSSETIGHTSYYYIVFKNFEGVTQLYVFPLSEKYADVKLKLYKYDDTLLTIECLENKTSNLNPFGNWSYMVYHINDDSTGWVRKVDASKSQTETINIPMTDSFKLLESNTNIYTSRSSEDVFFPVAPTQDLTVEEMIAQETPVMAEKITQAMREILIIAVGSLALLISLVVLFKVFWTYRVR